MSGDLDDIFTEGWRDPSDDCERGFYYLVLLATLVLSVAGLYVAIRTLTFRMDLLPNRFSGWFTLGMSVFFGGVSAWVLWRESKHWDLKHMTAERFVAGGFLLGFGLIFTGLQIGSRTGRAGAHVHGDLGGGFMVAGYLVGFGALDITAFLLIGLVIAYLPRLRPRRRWRAVVYRRWALDDKFNEIDGHPCPTADGLTPCVEIVRPDGSHLRLRASSTAYDQTGLRSQGWAVVRGNRLERFESR